MTPREIMATLPSARERRRTEFYLMALAAQGAEKDINELLQKLDGK